MQRVARSDVGSGNWMLSLDQSASGADWDRHFRVIYDRYGALVYTMVCRSGVPFSDVEDLTQRVFMVVFRRLKEGEEVVHWKSWLRMIALRVVQEHRRWHRVRRLKAWVTQSSVDEQEREIPTPEREASQAEAVDTVAWVMSRMSTKLRDVLVLTDLQECTPSEAAELLGIPVNTVRSRRRLAKEQFAKILEKAKQR